jgi:hypothetical protein
MRRQVPGPGCGWPRPRSGTKVLTSDDEGQLFAYDASTTVEAVAMRTCPMEAPDEERDRCRTGQFAFG